MLNQSSFEVALQWSTIFVIVAFGLLVLASAWAVVYHHISLRRWYESVDDGDEVASS